MNALLVQEMAASRLEHTCRGNNCEKKRIKKRPTASSKINISFPS